MKIPMNFPRNIIVHHTAVSYDQNPNQFKAVDNYHKGLGWGMIGYQYLIEKDGTRKVGRDERQVGAHTKEKYMNFRSIGICLTGNFDIEDPTIEQKLELLKLINELQAKYRISDEKVFPHRHFAAKSCWGNRLPDNIIKYLNNPESIPDWVDKITGLPATTIWRQAKDVGLFSESSQFNEPLKKGELAIILKRASRINNF